MKLYDASQQTFAHLFLSAAVLNCLARSLLGQKWKAFRHFGRSIHAFIGTPGSNNDLNVSERSPLLVEFSNGPIIRAEFKCIYCVMEFIQITQFS